MLTLLEQAAGEMENCPGNGEYGENEGNGRGGCGTCAYCSIEEFLIDLGHWSPDKTTSPEADPN